jgi:hypothetical protein
MPAKSEGQDPGGIILAITRYFFVLTILTLAHLSSPPTLADTQGASSIPGRDHLSAYLSGPGGERKGFGWSEQ